jgi:glutathione S-transferase
MIDFYYWPTPNGWKVSIMLEECGLPYRTVPINIGKGDQFKPEFLAISPNNRMPATVDHDAEDGPVSVFESGAILLHLAERSGRFMPSGRKAQKEVMEWLFWQVGNLGPMAGQLSHFVNYAQGDPPLFAPALRQRVQPLPRRFGTAAGGPRVHRRRLFDCRHGELALGVDLKAAGPGARRFPECRTLARRGARPAGGQEGR